MPYKLVVLEGLDCSGKTTVSKLLEKRLEPCIIIRFPDRSTGTGRIIDEFLKKKTEVSPHELHLLYSANRYEKAEYIASTLKHSNIICDRYWLSGAVYSSAKGLDYEWCKSVDRYLPRPDHMFFIDVSTECTSQRRGFGSEAHDIVEFQEKVYSLYKQHAKSENLVIVDGTKRPECLAEEILNKVLG